MSRDIPIIFSAPMVRALLAGRKTQTRRLASSPMRKVQVGDRLWVRENLRLVSQGPADGQIGIAYAADPEMGRDVHTFSAPGHKLKRAGITPCIHMPRLMSRLTLIVEAVKVEPLQAISAADVRAEGVPDATVDRWRQWLHPDDCAGHAFGQLWDKIHGKGAWDLNPDVVALSFRVLRKNIDE